MAVYAIYKYDFTHAIQGDIENPKGILTDLDQAQSKLDSILKKQHNTLPLINPQKNVLDNDVLFHFDDVYIMIICNEKKHSYLERLEKKEMEYHPGCCVIIDNRKDIANIAIERTPSFSNNPDTVRSLLEEGINKELGKFGLAISIRAKVREASFWQVIDDYTKRHNDSIKKVTFNFPVPGKVGAIDATQKMKDKLAIMASIAQEMNGQCGSLVVQSNKESTLHIDQASQDLAQMVQLCSMNAYDIKVQFKYHKIYRFGDYEKAMAGMEDYIIEDCLHNQLAAAEGSDTPIFHLIDWLNNIRGLLKDYTDEGKIIKKKKKRS